MWWDVLVQFLDLFIAAGGGFVIGVGFMMIVIASTMRNENRDIMRLQQEVLRLEEELESAARDRQDEHPEVGRSPPLSPMGDLPGAGGGPLGDASVGRKG